MLSQTAVRRLRAAIEFMETRVPRKHFNMDHWAISNTSFGKRGKVLKARDLQKCGTTACAAGWLATSPAWRRAGIEITAELYRGSINRNKVRRYLEIDDDQFGQLFYAGVEGGIRTPKQWARKARKLLAAWAA